MEARLAMESLMRHRRARRRKKLIAGGIVGVIVLVGAVAWGISRFTGNAGGGDSPQLMTTFVDRGDFTEAVEDLRRSQARDLRRREPRGRRHHRDRERRGGGHRPGGRRAPYRKNDELDKAIRDAEMGVRNAKPGVSQAQSAYATTLEAYNKIEEIKDDKRHRVQTWRRRQRRRLCRIRRRVRQKLLSDAQEAYNIAVANAENARCARQKERLGRGHERAGRRLDRLRRKRRRPHPDRRPLRR